MAMGDGLPDVTLLGTALALDIALVKDAEEEEVVIDVWLLTTWVIKPEGVEKGNSKVSESCD